MLISKTLILFRFSSKQNASVLLFELPVHTSISYYGLHFYSLCSTVLLLAFLQNKTSLRPHDSHIDHNVFSSSTRLKAIRRLLFKLYKRFKLIIGLLARLICKNNRFNL